MGHSNLAFHSSGPRSRVTFILVSSKVWYRKSSMSLFPTWKAITVTTVLYIFYGIGYRKRTTDHTFYATGEDPN
jgi:hypothetical protein